VRRISSSLLLLVGLLGSTARAEPAAVGVEYVAPPDCPSAEVFAQQIAARTPVFREHLAEHAVRVEIVSEPGGVLGRASLVLSGHAAERELRAARCEEVVEALALVVAILIDPNADTRPIPVSSAATVAATPEPEPAVPPAPVRTEPAPAARRPLPERPRPSEPRRAEGPGYRFIAGAHLAAEGAVAPELTVGPRVFFGVDLQRAWPWPSSFRLSGARLFSRRMRDASGSAKLTLDAARADACFLRIRDGDLALEPCAGLDVGLLRVDGQHPLGGHDHTLFWADAGALVRGSVTVLDRIVGEAEIGADVPVVQYRYGFQGQPALFQSARVGMHLGVGLGVRFP
jgi:hypothetical protein